MILNNSKIKTALVTSILLLTSVSFVSLGNVIKKISWFEINYPPAYFVKGDMKSKGFSQQAMKFYIANLPEYTHNIEFVNMKRIQKTLLNPSKIYCSAMLGIEKEEFDNALYTETNAMVPAVGLVIRNKDRTKFTNQAGETSLTELLKDTSLLPGLLASMNLGKNLTPIVNQYKKSGGVLMERATLDQVSFYQMLILNRVDYIFDYAFSYFEIAKNLTKTDQEQLLFVHIVENDKLQASRAVCNNVEGSQVVIDKINMMTDTMQFKELISEEVTRFIPENLRENTKYQNMELIGK